MLKPNAKTLARKEAFRKIGEAISRRGVKGPTLFNPHFAIKGVPSADPLLTSRLGNGKARGTKGPAMKTTQWEATGRRAK